LNLDHLARRASNDFSEFLEPFDLMRLQQGKSCHCQIPLDSNRAVGDYIALSGVAIEARFATRACFERRGDASRRSLIWINIAKNFPRFPAIAAFRTFGTNWTSQEGHFTLSLKYNEK
jgi:hypothetical protein